MNVMFRMRTPTGCMMGTPVGNVTGLERHKRGTLVLTRSAAVHSQRRGLIRDGKKHTISTEPMDVLQRWLARARAMQAEADRGRRR